MEKGTTTRAAVATCPDCGEKITLKGEIWLGKRLDCPNCDAYLEVVETIPVELDWVYDEEFEDEDYEDVDYDDEEEEDDQ